MKKGSWVGIGLAAALALVPSAGQAVWGEFWEKFTQKLAEYYQVEITPSAFSSRSEVVVDVSKGGQKIGLVRYNPIKDAKKTEGEKKDAFELLLIQLLAGANERKTKHLEFRKVAYTYEDAKGKKVADSFLALISVEANKIMKETGVSLDAAGEVQLRTASLSFADGQTKNIYLQTDPAGRPKALRVIVLNKDRTWARITVVNGVPSGDPEEGRDG